MNSEPSLTAALATVHGRRARPGAAVLAFRVNLQCDVLAPRAPRGTAGALAAAPRPAGPVPRCVRVQFQAADAGGGRRAGAGHPRGPGAGRVQPTELP